MTPSATRSLDTFLSTNPTTGDVVGHHEIFDDRAVSDAVERARPAALRWAELGWSQRKRRLLNWKRTLMRGLPRLASLINRETAKPLPDAQLEVILAINHLDWAARNARRVLRARRVGSGLFMLHQVSVLEYRPFGVVGVIGPWNYPVFTPMGSIAYALAAGNAVVFKPSELSPGSGEYLAETFATVAADRDVLQTITGFGETGRALTAHPEVDKIAFTGSSATAREVMKACADHLTPLVAECGGNDAMIVDADADLPAAASAAVWGAMSNAGQTCTGIERVYVASTVFDEFVALLVERASALRPGPHRAAAYGPMTMAEQIGIVEGHVREALARGARAPLGGADAIRPPYIDPVVLTEVPDDSALMCQETFGPVIAVRKVADAQEGVRLANASAYGLGATVFSGKRSKAMRLARRLRSGMTAINSVVAYAAVPALPYGGLGESGFGRIHGADGLREFSRAKAITRQRFRPLADLASFERSEPDMERVLRLMTLLHGGPPR